MTIGKDTAGGFNSTATAAWPPRLCDALAEKVVDHFLSCNGKAQEAGEARQGTEQQQHHQPGDGGEQQPRPQEDGERQPRPPGEERRQRLPGEVELQEGLPPQATTSRRALDDFEKAELRAGRSIEGVYVGRPSVWGNPYKLNVDGSRKDIIKLYREYLLESGLSKRVGELRSSVLRRHCRNDQACHADALIDLAEESQKSPLPQEEEDHKGEYSEKDIEELGGRRIGTSFPRDAVPVGARQGWRRTWA